MCMPRAGPLSGCSQDRAAVGAPKEREGRETTPSEPGLGSAASSLTGPMPGLATREVSLTLSMDTRGQNGACLSSDLSHANILFLK